MKNKPLVSIIMNCLDGERFLAHALNSVLKQKFKNWELIFWDNQSTDKSKKIFKKFKDRRFKYFYARKKTNLYRARNLAIKKSKGKFLAFLDVDDFWTVDKLQRQIPKFKDKKVSLVYGNFYKFFDKNKKKEIAFNSYLPEGYILPEIIKDYKVGLSTVLIRKKSIKNHNKIFNDKYDLISDFDFILHFSKKNYFACVNKPLAYYRIHNNQLQKKELINQAKQYYKWYKEKKIEINFKNYDLETLRKKFNYYDMVKNLNNNKIYILKKIFKNFDLKSTLKVIALLLIPKKILVNFIKNV
jgi:glycosyltransferase involved in cell wall biosynthesis